MRWLRRYWPYVVLVLLLAANGAVVWQRQWIGDWLRLRDYQPPAAITTLATETAMTDYSRHLFYLNHPQLETKESFNTHCADLDIETSVLGCFHGDRQGIYLYNVQDQRLHGVQEVTAAHEMLHQAYERLSKSERARVTAQLEDYYTNQLKDEDVRAKLETYKKQPNVVLANEMHSIFGSEVRTLPASLENYYKRYFTDRRKVVSYSEAYQGEFKRRKQLVTEYDQQLDSLNSQIEANKRDLERRSKELKTEEAAINDDVARQDYPAYQADVQAYNSAVAAYNAKITATRGLIDKFNSIVTARNEIAVEEQQLQQALDSRIAPATAQ